jgi:hypothetical protein
LGDQQKANASKTREISGMTLKRRFNKEMMMLWLDRSRNLKTGDKIVRVLKLPEI